MRFLLFTIVVVGSLGGLVWYRYFYHGDVLIGSEVTAQQAKNSDVDGALQLIYKARDEFAGVKDYQCTFLRDEFIDGELKKNHLILKVRHQPFSVYMEWIAPTNRKGRKTSYVVGQNEGKMRVRDGITLSLDPQQSVKMKESRHTIVEAGLQNLIKRFVESWEMEKKMGVTDVTVQDLELKVMLPSRDVVLNCKLVTTTHDPKDRAKFVFYRTLVYFDKNTGLPVRLEGYDWPKDANDRTGQLVERYTYLDVKVNVGLKDADFKL